jgi:signal transduction histidine kinase
VPADPEAAARRAGFAVDLALDPAAAAELDGPIKQVVLNLLENSLKFSTRGARIRVSTFWRRRRGRSARAQSVQELKRTTRADLPRAS